MTDPRQEEQPMHVRVVQWENKLRATFEDGRELICNDAQELGWRLRGLGVAPTDVSIPDWREGDIAPHSGIKIALFMAMKGTEKPGHRT